jgi:hypothetical protein
MKCPCGEPAALRLTIKTKDEITEFRFCVAHAAACVIVGTVDNPITVALEGMMP